MAQGGQIGNNQPVILNSIHNDGVALDLKIRDMVRMKFDESEKKGRLKEERLLQLELNAGKTEEALATTVHSMN